MKTLDASNPDMLLYKGNKLEITLLGGIRLSQLDQLRCTLKIEAEKPIRITVNLYNDQHVQKLMDKLSDRLQIAADVVEQEIGELINELELYRLQKLDYLSNPSKHQIELTEQQQKQAMSYLRSKKLKDNLLTDFETIGVIGENTSKLILFIVYCSRLMSNPLHVICKGSSSSGKTSLITGIAKTIPDSDKLELTALTKNSLFFTDSKQLDKKLLLIEDLDGCDPNALLSLRELISRHRLTKQIVRPSKINGELKSATITLEAKVATVAATTRNVYLDNANRSLVITVGDDAKQTQQIHDYQKKLYGGLLDEKLQRTTLERLQHLQTILKPMEVINPYTQFLELPNGINSPRRTMQIYLQFINAVAFVWQYQRKVDSKGRVIVQPEDVALANELLRDVLIDKTDELRKPVRELLMAIERLLEQRNSKTFTAKEIREELGIKPSTLKKYLKELIDYYYVGILSGNPYKGYVYRVLSSSGFVSISKRVDSCFQNTMRQIK